VYEFKERKYFRPSEEEEGESRLHQASIAQSIKKKV